MYGQYLKCEWIWVCSIFAGMYLQWYDLGNDLWTWHQFLPEFYKILRENSWLCIQEKTLQKKTNCCVHRSSHIPTKELLVSSEWWIHRPFSHPELRLLEWSFAKMSSPRSFTEKSGIFPYFPWHFPVKIPTKPIQWPEKICWESPPAITLAHGIVQGKGRAPTAPQGGCVHGEAWAKGSIGTVSLWRFDQKIWKLGHL